MALKVPWSKQHKTITGGLPLSFLNSYTELLSMPELVELTRARGDHALVDAFDQHGLEYTANGGSLDLRQTIASLYGDAIGADNILVFCGGPVGLRLCAIDPRRSRHRLYPRLPIGATGAAVCWSGCHDHPAAGRERLANPTR